MRCTHAVLLFGVVACSNSPIVAPLMSEPEAPAVPVPAAAVSAQYVLALVNDAPLPSASPTGAGEWDYDGARYQLEGATLTFHVDGTYMEHWIHRRTTGGDLVSQSFVGRYTRLSDSTLQVGAGDGATRMTLTATGLAWQFAGFTLTYDRQK